MAETRGRQTKKGWLGIGIDIFKFSAYAYDYGTGTVVDGSWGEKFEGLGWVGRVVHVVTSRSVRSKWVLEVGRVNIINVCACG